MKPKYVQTWRNYTRNRVIDEIDKITLHVILIVRRVLPSSAAPLTNDFKV